MPLSFLSPSPLLQPPLFLGLAPWALWPLAEAHCPGSPAGPAQPCRLHQPSSSQLPKGAPFSRPPCSLCRQASVMHTHARTHARMHVHALQKTLLLPERPWAERGQGRSGERDWAPRGRGRGLDALHTALWGWGQSQVAPAFLRATPPSCTEQLSSFLSPLLASPLPFPTAPPPPPPAGRAGLGWPKVSSTGPSTT